MFFRAAIFAGLFIVAACGGAEVTLEDRIQDAGTSCKSLVSNASLKTAGLEPDAYCACMVSVLEEWPEDRAVAVSHTLVYMSKHAETEGLKFKVLATKLIDEANAPDASDLSANLGVGVGFVNQLVGRVSRRASNNKC